MDPKRVEVDWVLQTDTRGIRSSGFVKLNDPLGDDAPAWMPESGTKVVFEPGGVPLCYAAQYGGKTDDKGNYQATLHTSRGDYYFVFEGQPGWRRFFPHHIADKVTFKVVQVPNKNPQ